MQIQTDKLLNKDEEINLAYGIRDLEEKIVDTILSDDDLISLMIEEAILYLNGDINISKWVKSIKGDDDSKKTSDVVRQTNQLLAALVNIQSNRSESIVKKAKDLLYEINISSYALSRISDTSNNNDIKDLHRKLKKARNIFVNSNIKLVISVAKKYLNRGLEFNDLVQEGVIGLLKAVDKYSPDKGWRFSTYATWWIRQAINRSISDQGKIIRMPVHTTEVLNKIRSFSKVYEQENQTEPSYEEVARYVKMTPEKVRTIMESGSTPVSMSAPTSSCDGESFGSLSDFIADNKPDPYTEASFSEMKSIINEALKVLSPAEEMVVRMKFGLGTGDPKTLNEMAETFGKSRSRVGQIYQSGISALRRHKRKELIEHSKKYGREPDFT